MKFSLLSLFFLCLGLRAQILPPGAYHHLKPTEPMVLDTGSFTFVDLEMKNLGEGLWLDARKAKLLELQSCKFENTKRGKATAILVHGSLKIHNSTIRNMDCGIKVLGNNNTLSIHQNTFENLSNAVWLQSGTHTLADFRCNNFIYNLTGSGNQGVGLFVGGNLPGQGAPALTGPIGDNGDDGNPDPSGNAWPITPQSLIDFPPSGGPAVITNWQSPANWTSLKNDNPNFNLEYWAYNNEFVRNISSPNTSVRTKLPGGEQIMMFRSGIANPPDDVEGVVVYRAQCNTDLPDVFPLRMAVDPNPNNITSNAEVEIGAGQNVLLGDAIPNPASSHVRIPIFIPEKSEKEYKLFIFNLNGRKVLSELAIVEKGKAKVEMSLSNLPAGVYGYSLSENGRTLGTRKLVVIK